MKSLYSRCHIGTLGPTLVRTDYQDTLNHDLGGLHVRFRDTDCSHDQNFHADTASESPTSTHIPVPVFRLADTNTSGQSDELGLSGCSVLCVEAVTITSTRHTPNAGPPGRDRTNVFTSDKC